MKKYLLFIIPWIWLCATPALAFPPSMPAASGLTITTDCDVATNYPIGSPLCQQTGDGKLFKGTGAAVEEITAGSPGDIAHDTLWDAAGDLVQGTGANTAAKITKGTEGTILRAGAALNAYSTATFADTYAKGTILYNAAANTVAGLAHPGAANYILATNAADTAAWLLATNLSAINALTFADASIIQLTGAGTAAVLTSGGNNYFLGSNSDNSALEFKTPANVLSQIGAQASDSDLSAIAALSVAEGKFIVGNSSPAWSLSSYTLPTTVPTVGKVFISDGTNMIASTALGTAAYAATGDFQAPLTYPVTGVASPTAGYLVKWGVSGNAIVDGPKLGTMTDGKWCTYTTADGFKCVEDAPAGTGEVTDVGDCTGGACYDGSADGGTYVRLYDGTGAYMGLTAGVRTLTLGPSNASAENLILTFGDNNNTVTLTSGTGANILDLSAFTLTVAGLNAAATATPTYTFLDSDAPGTDKEVGKIVGAYIDGADGAENGTASIYAMEGGTDTEYIKADGKNTVVSLLKPVKFTGAASPATAGGTTAGTAALPFSSVYIGNAATNNIQLTGTSSAARSATIPDIAANSTFLVTDTTTTSAGKIPLSTTTAGKHTYSTPTYPTSSATARKMMVSDGTNWVASTELWPIATTSGNMLVADGTNWVTTAPTGTGSPMKGTGPSMTPQIIDGHAAASPTSAQLSNAIVNNYGQAAADVNLTGPTPAAGMNFVMIAGTAQGANYWRYTSTTNNVYLDAAGPYTYVQFATPAVGDSLSCFSFQTGASSYSLRCTTLAGTATGA